MESEGNYKIHLGIHIKREWVGICDWSELQIKNLRDNLDVDGGWSDCLQLQRVDIPLICLISPGHAWSKQDKTKQNAGETLHCGVGINNVPPTETEEETSSQHLHWSEIWRGLYCNVSWHYSQCTRQTLWMGKQVRILAAQCHLNAHVPNFWLVDVRAVSALWWLRGR